MYRFQIMWKDIPVANITMSYKEEDFSIHVLNEEKVKLHPFKKNKSYNYVKNFLEDRRVHLGRPDREELFSSPSISGDFFAELQDTKAIDYDDPIWLKFDGDQSNWSDNNPRR